MALLFDQLRHQGRGLGGQFAQLGDAIEQGFGQTLALAGPCVEQSGDGFLGQGRQNAGPIGRGGGAAAGQAQGIGHTQCFGAGQPSLNMLLHHIQALEQGDAGGAEAGAGILLNGGTHFHFATFEVAAEQGAQGGLLGA